MLGRNQGRMVRAVHRLSVDRELQHKLEQLIAELDGARTRLLRRRKSHKLRNTLLAAGGVGAAALAATPQVRGWLKSKLMGAGAGPAGLTTIEERVDVDVPVATAYNQWTQFEDFPRFMAGVKQVKQLDDTHVHWHAEIWGKDKEWDAEITEQVPDQVIAWRSTSGAPNAGTVRFEPLSHDRTRVRLIMEYEPEGVVEKTGDAIGVFSARVENTVEDFKKFIESRGAETGAWRGEVHGGQKTAQGGTRGGGGRTIR